MTDVLPIAVTLTATPVDPLATAATPASAIADDADPFAEMLAVLVAPPAAAVVAGSGLPIPAVTADTDTATVDDPTLPDPVEPDDTKIDDSLAADLTAMLALAPPPPPTAAAAFVPAAQRPSAPAADATAVVARTVAKAPIAPVADTTPLPTVAATDQTAAAPQAAIASDPGRSAAADAPTKAAATPASPVTPEPAKLADMSAAAPITVTPVRTVPAPTLPAAILRMLREAPATAVQPSQPAAVAAPRTPIAAPPVTTGPANLAARRAGAETPRSEARGSTTRSTAPTMRAASAKTPRAADALRQASAEAFALPATEARAPAAMAAAAPTLDAAPADPLVQGQLAIGRDDRWLDSLARDIAASAGGRDLHFTLAPENLGALTVSIAAAADGAAIRMTTDTDRAHQILTDAQPRLIAEARAQGLRVSESHVELNNGSNGSGGSAAWGQGNGQAQAQAQSERRPHTSSPNRLPLEPTSSSEAIEGPAKRTSERYA